jgi:hypothetical protein
MSMGVGVGRGSYLPIRVDEAGCLLRQNDRRLGVRIHPSLNRCFCVFEFTLSASILVVLD